MLAGVATLEARNFRGNVFGLGAGVSAFEKFRGSAFSASGNKLLS